MPGKGGEGGKEGARKRIDGGEEIRRWKFEKEENGDCREVGGRKTDRHDGGRAPEREGKGRSPGLGQDRDSTKGAGPTRGDFANGEIGYRCENSSFASLVGITDEEDLRLVEDICLWRSLMEQVVGAKIGMLMRDNVNNVHLTAFIRIYRMRYNLVNFHHFNS